MNKVIAIDPSGTGTTAIYNNDLIMSGTKTFTSENWQEHYHFLVEEIKYGKYDTIIVETLTPKRIGNQATKHLINLAKLLGCLEEHFKFANIVWVIASDTKRLMKKLKTMEFGEQLYGIKKIKVGRAIKYRAEFKDLTTHEIDSVAIYHIWKDKEDYIKKTTIAKEKK